MRFLIDTNVVILLEPVSSADIEPLAELAAHMARDAAQLGVPLLLHPETRQELASDKARDRREVRQVRLEQYPPLEDPPGIEEVEDILGPVNPESHDHVDHLLLAAVHGDAVSYLVTEDAGIHRKARQLDVGDPIFESLREDYTDFDDWFRRICRTGRDTWVVDVPGSGHYAGLCIWKERDEEYGFGDKGMKLSTFKISEQHRGKRYGELLLKAVFKDLSANAYDHVWLTVFEKHKELILLLEDFGFRQHHQRTKRGELVMFKRLRPSNGLEADPFEYHRRFGPPAIDLGLGGEVYVIPIKPEFFTRLFPDYPEGQGQLLPEDVPYGNALRKAYICQSGITPPERGATVLFYRSGD